MDHLVRQAALRYHCCVWNHPGRSAYGAAKEDVGNEERCREARKAVDAAKVGVEERGPASWTDGDPDLNRHMARTTTFA
ncbi:hypothetical protein GFM09_21665 [Rhizobium leguminosarum bv. viciae]|nr:hypothetical protein [Rhizobium leguminosarum bv. viciae]NKL71849.1 hypothetical protein [Rhizobium leguminosarum bv. viciae]NKL88316.1 hypothetical protein [Rhizobium leguminosarum bv. viciae]